MHYDRIGARALQQSAVHLEILKVTPSLERFAFLAHRGPRVSINNVDVSDCLQGIICEETMRFAPQPPDEVFVGFVARGAGYPQLKMNQRGRFDPALRQIETITDEGDSDLAQIPVPFAQRVQVPHQL